MASLAFRNLFQRGHIIFADTRPTTKTAKIWWPRIMPGIQYCLVQTSQIVQVVSLFDIRIVRNSVLINDLNNNTHRIKNKRKNSKWARWCAGYHRVPNIICTRVEKINPNKFGFQREFWKGDHFYILSKYHLLYFFTYILKTRAKTQQNKSLFQ